LQILCDMNANTAFTYTCPLDSEIVIFRKEEWFKVLIHESFHNFALDFSDVDNQYCKETILSLFPIHSDVNLYEAYTEFWARIMNCLFSSYFLSKTKNEFYYFAENFIYLEINYSLFQMCKVLQFMGLSYRDLYSKDAKAKIVRNNLYKEKTSIFAYYIITFILMFHYQEFLQWCNENNLSLIAFKKTNGNLQKFCEFIEKKYKREALLNAINMCCLQHIKIDKNQKKNKKKDIHFLKNNLRMTLFEIE